MLRSTFNSWREYLTPAYHTSTFNTTGEITPEEFVEAGDYLVYKFPTWQWSPAPPSKKRDFLPDDKQFLVTRKVPSYVRAGQYLGADMDDNEEIVTEDGWTQTRKPDTSYRPATKRSDQNSTEEFEEIDDLIDETAEDDDSDDNDNDATDDNYEVNPNKRSYDLFIYYSTAYRVPRMYLIGYDANGAPLTPDEMFEDISSDYRDKTVTIEKAPFLNDTTSISIHPCRHAAVMKVLINRAISAAKQKKLREYSEDPDKELTENIKKLGIADHQDDDWEDVDYKAVQEDEDQSKALVRVDQYLIIFLKFITSVTPGIEHDYTMDAF